MKRLAFFLLGILFFIFIPPIQSQERLAAPAGPLGCFPPDSIGTEKIIRELSKAKNSILVQTRYFLSAPMVKALWKAYQVGIRVEVILDKSLLGKEYSFADFFAHVGIPTKVDLAHTQGFPNAIIIDQGTVLSVRDDLPEGDGKTDAGSSIVILDKVSAGKYLKDWLEHKSHSESYTRKKDTSEPSCVPCLE